MRLGLIRRLVLLALGFIWAGLITTQVMSGPRYRKQAEENRIRLIHLPAARGAILDRHGIPLVEDRIGFELVALPHEIKNFPETWGRLQPILGVPAQELALRYRKGYQAPFAPIPLAKDLPSETAFFLEEKRWELPGTFIRAVPQRRYLLGSALGPLVGYLGMIAPEELTHLKPYGYTFRDMVGKDGLEQRYDSVLRGQNGGLQVEVDAKGRLIRQLGFKPPQAGKRITLSVDGRLQAACYRLLEGFAGAIIVADPSTGEILALSSRPTFDPGLFLDPTQRLEVKRILHHPERPMFNRATRALVPPGSTFKVAVAYEALQENKITAHTVFVCPGYYELGQGLFRCWKEEGHGPQRVSEALEHSCNVFFYQTGRRLKVKGIGSAAGRFGLGRATGIDLPREARGLVPDPEWLSKTYQQSWQEGDTVSFSIGQSALTVTPLQMLMLIEAVAAEGVVFPPHLLTAVEGQKVPAKKASRIPLDQEILAQVKQGLEAVVASPTGTGRLAQVAGISAAGKTGTAQVSKGLPHAWFIGYAPSQQPKVCFVIFLEHGGMGGQQAALVGRDLLATLHDLGYL